jgi:UDP-GlcNAc:undecaprenyl-phosphate GlcNAc-1-phosphate transferase
LKLTWINYLFLLLISSLLVGLLTPLIRKVALRFQIVDSPNQDHKTHLNPTPYMGGVSIALGIAVISFSATLLTNADLLPLLASILIPAVLLGAIGLIDDVFNLSPLPRFVAQSMVGLVVSLILVKTKTVGSPTGSDSVDTLITVFFVIALCNSINFFDNIDGGAAGAVTISSITLALLSAQSNQYYLAAMSVVVGGSTLGFLWWNKSPARIYMGDAGSLFLGVILASLLVRFEPNPIENLASFAVPLLVIAVPALDTAVVIVSRISRGMSPFRGGRDHLSHRLIALGLRKKSAVLGLWSLCSLFCLLALLLSLTPFDLEIYVTYLAIGIWLLLFVFFLAKPLVY